MTFKWSTCCKLEVDQKDVVNSRSLNKYHYFLVQRVNIDKKVESKIVSNTLQIAPLQNIPELCSGNFIEQNIGLAKIHDYNLALLFYKKYTFLKHFNSKFVLKFKMYSKITHQITPLKKLSGSKPSNLLNLLTNT